ncbi:MAG: signal peptidase I [Spirochaetaceae bacterium]|jgi:signal peptidase I|nr:signal peptidase I [Spirochaetaceae bacterium]
MFNKWKKYSYADQKTYVSRLRLLVLKIILIVFAYIMLTNVFFPMIVMRSTSMQPSISPGDRFIFSAFSIRGIFEELPFFEGLPYKRGDIVSIDMSSGQNIFFHIADKLIRFFTVGRAGLSGGEDRFFIKRVIALPGDEVSMANFIMQVRSADSPYTLTEYELSGKRLYKIDIPQVSSLWNEAIPFSGTLPKIVLGEDQCFVLSDDRSNTNDSRTWGPISIRAITGKALFRYWPLNKIGIP